MMSIFISYAKEDFHFATEIFHFLEAEGLNPWMDKKKLLPGQDWELVLAKTLKQVDFILIVISDISVSKRGYVQREFKRALELWKEHPESDIYILPVRVNECEVPESLSRFHWIDYHSRDFREKILEAINTQSKTPKPNQVRSISIEENKTFTTAKEKPEITKRKTKKNILWAVLMSLAFVIFLGFIIMQTFGKKRPKPELEQSQVLSLLNEYFDNIESLSYAEEAFADHIDTFYRKTDITRREVVNIRKRNDEFLATDHKIDGSSLKFVYEINGIRYWKFRSAFTCYRRSKQKYETACVELTFGLDKDFKITSVIEDVINFDFVTTRPDIAAIHCP